MITLSPKTENTQLNIVGLLNVRLITIEFIPNSGAKHEKGVNLSYNNLHHY